MKKYMKRMSSHIHRQLNGYFDIRIYPEYRIINYTDIWISVSIPIARY